MIDSLVGNDYSICLCNGIKNAGVDIRLIITEDREINTPINFFVLRWLPSKQREKNKFIKTVKYFKFHLKLLCFILKDRIDVVHYQFFRREGFETFFFMFLSLLKINLVYTAHNVLPHEKNRTHHLLKNIVYRFSSSIVVHSKFIKNILANNFNITKEKVCVIPHGNFDIYLPEKAISKSEARKNFNVHRDDHVLLFFGYIRKYKGLDLLLDAFGIASNQIKNLKLIISGAVHTKQLEQEYKQKIETINQEDNIIFHSEFIPSDKVANYFIASDIVMLPYKNIYHSGLMHLAYSFGRPVIATRVGDFTETIEHGKSGFLLETNDEKNLAKVIMSAVTDSNRLEQMGLYAQKLSKEKYSWNNIGYQTLELYKNLIQIMK
ncbi:glycosyltransferase family 4 protein [candidate division KSB1 bacterium]|nr:glycosyltransferase family 4 protein [candidate division KSB1 bacterium]MBL7093224.1 glycosyltransferase family 4 protein [candidate division KSB1 bacterium]